MLGLKVLYVLILAIFPIVSCLEMNNAIRSESVAVPGESSRQCECWVWPTCISNCTVNPILKVLFEKKHEKIAKIRTPFVVIFPYQVRKQNNTKIDTNTVNNKGEYRVKAKFWIQLLNGEDVQLKLQKSRILGNMSSKSGINYKLKYYTKTGQIISDSLRKCFYTGSVTLDPSPSPVAHSYVAVDTCDGLRGIILNKGNVFGILPMKYPSSKENEPIAHFIYSETTSTIERVAKNLTSFWYMFGTSGEMYSDNSVHVIPITLVIDRTLMKAFDFDTEKASKFALSVLNMVTKSFMSLKQIELELASVELWNVNDKFPISKHIKTTLNDFLKLRLQDPDSVSKHHRGEMTILLSGWHFIEEVEYFSVPGSVCTKRSMSVVQVTSVDEVYHVSRLISLAIAEMFGINSFPCPDIYECSSKTVLSKGDESRLKLALLSGPANCLKKESSMKVVDTCGNGKLDRGEECDNVRRSESPDDLRCCDKTTCMVANYAQCNGGECCSSNCTFHSRGRICRPSKDHCDIPEFCSGEMDSCPQDLFLENGNPCNKGSALCYQGRCPTRDSRCQALWGQKAQEANQHCYSTFNLKHDDSCGSKKKCTVENQMCGILHCKGGSESPNDFDSVKPSQKVNPIFIDTYLQFKNEKIQCKYLNNIESAYVEDGTECGNKMYCFGKICSSPQSKIVSKCPKDKTNNVTKYAICYNKGICTNLGICLCYPGWIGSNCSIRANESMAIGEFGYVEQTKNYIWAYFKEIGMYNGSLYKDINMTAVGNGDNLPILTTVTLIVILGSVIGLLFILLIIFMVCYRRKINHRPKRSDGYSSNGMKISEHKTQDKYDSTNCHSYITEDGSRIFGRKQSSNNPGKKEADLKYDHVVTSGGKRRGRRHRRRSSNGSSNRRLCRDTGDGNESLGAVSDYGGHEHEWNRTRPGGAQSDNDLHNSCLTGKVNDDLGNSIEKIIKFGNMPSYKEDKLNRSLNNSPSTNTNIASISQDTDSSLLTRSSDPLLANISSPSNSESQSLLRTSTNSYPISQQCTNYLSSMPPSLSTSPLPVASPDKKDPMSFTNKMFCPPFGLPAPALFPSIPYTSNPMANVPLSNCGPDKVFDLSLKQPEKGILKNKSSGDLKEIVPSSKTHKGAHSCSKKNKHKHHNCGTTTNDSNSATSPSSASQSSLSSCDSNSSSCSSSSSTSSSASSATSSIVTPPHGRKNHHKPKTNNRRSQNNPLPAPPTILCNAGNQTDEFNNANSRLEFQPPKPVSTTGEEDIEECDEEDCEECMKARAEHINKSPPETLLTSNSSAYDIVGSNDDGYHHYNPNNLRFNPDLSVHYDCHAMPQSGYSLPTTNDEHSEQNSETEVDSHLQNLINNPSNFFPSGGINKYMAPVPFPDSSLMSDVSMKRAPISGQYNQPYTSLNTYPYYYVTSSSQMSDSNSPHDNDDINSEVSISAYCRMPTVTNNKIHNEHLSRLNPGTTGSDQFSNTCFDGASNDGTIEGSDTSSLPDAHCDLLNLANLGIGPSRPNPMLSCLLRGQSTGKKGQDLIEFSTNAIMPNSMWSPSRNDNRSPGHLPPPNTYSVGSDYLA